MDLGTNSCRLLIAEKRDGRIITVRQELRNTRLGKGLDINSKKITKEALNKTFMALSEYERIMSCYTVKKVFIVATQAVREAENGVELVAQIKNKFKWDLEIINGKREAWLSYIGAKKGLKLTERIFVIDIGGGSTEFISEVQNKEIVAVSIPIGALRLHENPLTIEQIWNLLSENLTLTGLEIMKERKPYNLVGVGGTCTSCAAIKLALKEYDRDLVHGTGLTKYNIEEILDKLYSLSSQERLRIPGVYPGREDIIISGIKILLVIMEYLNKEQIIVSDEDILYGLIYEDKKID